MYSQQTIYDMDAGSSLYRAAAIILLHLLLTCIEPFTDTHLQWMGTDSYQVCQSLRYSLMYYLRICHIFKSQFKKWKYLKKKKQCVFFKSLISEFNNMLVSSISVVPHFISPYVCVGFKVRILTVYLLARFFNFLSWTATN